MGTRSGALVRRRQLARILRDLRRRSGMTIEDLAPRLDFSPSKLSRIENAHQGVDVHAVRTMMDIFGVTGEEWEALLALTRQASAKGWWRAYGLDDQGYVPLEAEASAVREYTVNYLPGLLQTADYARALFESSLQGRLRPPAVAGAEPRGVGGHDRAGGRGVVRPRREEVPDARPHLRRPGLAEEQLQRQRRGQQRLRRGGPAAGRRRGGPRHQGPVPRGAPPLGPAWRAFLTGVRAGEFGPPQA